MLLQLINQNEQELAIGNSVFTSFLVNALTIDMPEIEQKYHWGALTKNIQKSDQIHGQNGCSVGKD